MHIQPIDSTNFGILQKVKTRPYGTYMEGMYKGFKIEVFDAYKNNQKLIYVSKDLHFIKSKLIYWLEGIKKIARAEGRQR